MPGASIGMGAESMGGGSMGAAKSCGGGAMGGGAACETGPRETEPERRTSSAPQWRHVKDIGIFFLQDGHCITLLQERFGKKLSAIVQPRCRREAADGKRIEDLDLNYERESKTDAAFTAKLNRYISLKKKD
jgi:hypothetical protein